MHLDFLARSTPAVYIYLFFWRHYVALEALKEQELQDYYQAKIEQDTKYVTQKAVVDTMPGLKQIVKRIVPEEVLPGYMIKLTAGCTRMDCEPSSRQEKSVAHLSL